MERIYFKFRTMKANKDSYWFRHDSNASRDLKLMKIRIIYDFWGLGIYWSIVEFLREQSNYKYEYSENNMQILCDIIGCKDLIKFNNFISDSLKIGLFTVDKKNLFYTNSLIIRMEKWESCKNNGMKPKRSQTEAKAKPNGSIIEDNIREDNIREDKSKNNNLLPKKQEKKFVPPSKEEVINYFTENQYSKGAAEKAWMGYDVANWIDSNGKIIRNWKQKMIHVWFTDDNKIKGSTQKEITRLQFYNEHPQELQRVGGKFEDVPENVWNSIEKREKIKFI